MALPFRHWRLTTSAILVLLALLASSGAGAADAQLSWRLSGIDKALKRNVSLHLGELDAALAEQPARLQRIVERAVTEALQPFGYYEAGCRVEIGPERVEIRVEAGPRVRFLTPEVQLDESLRALAPVAALLATAKIGAGEPLSHPEYERVRDELLRLAHRLGFLDARYTRTELQIDRGAREARAVLQLDAGVRSHFGEVTITGTDVRPALLLALAPFLAGDSFDAELLARFEQRLRDTGYFHDLAITLHQEAPDIANLTVLAEDVTTSRYEVGAGFSTDSRLRLRFRRLSPLLNERGHSLSIGTELSEPRQTVEGLWRIPHSDPLDDVFEVTAGLQGKQVEDTDSVTATLGLRHALKLYEDWSVGYGMSAELERYTLGSESEKTVAYLMPAMSLARRELEPGIDPRHGYSLWSAVDFSDRVVGAPADFLRWRGSLKWLAGLPDDNTTLFTRLELGAIWTDAFNAMPASLRFSAGGDNSIRGYDLESLGPRDVNGKLIGGRYLAVGSLELSRRVLPKWRLAAFVDGGGAFTERHDHLYQSAGIGLRWLSPVGQIRFDLAVPLHDRENSGFKLHISMGPPL